MDRLDFLLHGYDHDYKRFLIDGFNFGFRLGFMGDERSLESSNLKSALSLRPLGGFLIPPLLKRLRYFCNVIIPKLG